METKYKYIGTVALSVLATFMISLGVDLNVDTVAYDQGYLPYSCDLEHVDDYMCYKLSRVGETTLVNRNCYYDRNRGRKYKVCSTGWERIINIDDLDLAEVCPESTECEEPTCPDNDCSICPKEIEIKYVTKYVDNPCPDDKGSCNCPDEKECKDSENAIVLARIPNYDCTLSCSTLNYYCSGFGEDGKHICTNSEDLSQELLDDLMCW